MKRPRLAKIFYRVAAILFAAYVGLGLVVYFGQRSILFFPSHAPQFSRVLLPWKSGDRCIGFCREVETPKTIWLMMHGNAGQADEREYALSHISAQDSFYVLEYPGFGARPGEPSSESINAAALEAYQLLRTQHPGIPVCILGESLGSGPACTLAEQKLPPDKIVLVVPFDVLSAVAGRRFPFLPVRLMMKDVWDNVQALKYNAVPVEIYGALNDAIIPIEHAMNLARQIPRAKFVAFTGGHNDWSSSKQVKVEP